MTLLTRARALRFLESEYESMLLEARQEQKRFHYNPKYMDEPEMDRVGQAQDLLKSVQILSEDTDDYKDRWEVTGE